jgi:shikimate dehydrogenase
VEEMKKVYAVIGDPIAHSMSPAIHNDAFEKEGIDAEYLAFHVKPDGLEDAVKGMKALGVCGFNITLPHKETVIPFLDEVDELARAIGAVNTVVNKDGRLIGYNTDGIGYIKALEEELTGELTTKKTLIIGAGGAARAIYFTLVKEGVKQVDIANRTKERAVTLVSECPYDNSSEAFTIMEAEERVAEYDLIIQTTSIGMSPNVDNTPLDVTNMKASACVSDIIYNPLQTKILVEAEQNGAHVQNGVGMFAYQGAIAFQIWTGVMPDTGRMKQIVLNNLGG